MPYDRHQNRQAVACIFVVLLCGHEALAAREIIQMTGAIRSALEHDRQAPRAHAEEDANVNGAPSFERDALGKLEDLYEKVSFEVREWSKSRPENEALEASLTEMHAHLNRTVLSSGQFSGALDASALNELHAELNEAKKKVENLNLFLCKRSYISGYVDDGFLWQERELKDGHFSVKCSLRQNLLNHGKVGESASGKDAKAIADAIDTLKGFTRVEPHEDSSVFPIKLKMCTREGGCSNQGNTIADSQEDIFGEGGLTDKIPIPEQLKKYLPRASHQASHLYAVCFDDQDDCEGAMWVPRNLQTCTGWFEADDTRATLGQLRDAVLSGWWSRFWTPSGKERLVKSMKGGDKDLLKDEAVLQEDIQADTSKANSHACALRDWQESEELSTLEEIKEVRAELNKIIQELYGAKQAIMNLNQEYRKRIDLNGNTLVQEHQKIVIAEKLDILKLKKHNLREAAVNICKDAEAAGQGVNCGRMDSDCLTLAQDCAAWAQYTLQETCQTREQMSQQLEKQESDKEGGANVEADGRAVEESSGHSRRRRRTHAMPVFPAYYYYHQPYCYSWHRTGYYGGYYAYPIVPMYGYGPRVGHGMYSPYVLSPGMAMDHLMIHAMVRLVYYSAVGIGHVASNIGGAIGSGVGNLSCDGEACLAILAVLAFFILLIVIYLVYKGVSAYCSDEEKCRSWWYRGGRMRKKARKWAGLWTGIEDHVYSNLHGYLFFDATLNDPQDAKCVKSMQWGRRWVRKTDGRWMVRPSTEELTQGYINSERS